MAVKVETMYTMSFPGESKLWKFTDADITNVDGTDLVALDGTNTSLRTSIIQDPEACKTAAKDRFDHSNHERM